MKRGGARVDMDVLAPSGGGDGGLAEEHLVALGLPRLERVRKDASAGEREVAAGEAWSPI